MDFEVDKQTLHDLDLFSEERNKKSVFSVFNNAITYGGINVLKEMINPPPSDVEYLIPEMRQ